MTIGYFTTFQRTEIHSIKLRYNNCVIVANHYVFDIIVNLFKYELCTAFNTQFTMQIWVFIEIIIHVFEIFFDGYSGFIHFSYILRGGSFLN